MLTRGWLLGVVLASALACGSRSTRGDSDKSNQNGANGGTLGGPAPNAGAGGQGKVPAGGPAVDGDLAGAAGDVAAGGVAAGGVAAGGVAAGGVAAGGVAAGGVSSSGCMEMVVTCTAFVTIPISSLPDGTLVTCAGAGCLEQAVTDGHIASGRVELVDSALRATWSVSGFGFLTPSCVDPAGNSLSFRSPGGAVVVLFSGDIPLVVSQKPCLRESKGGVVLQQPAVDIAALAQALESGAGGEGGGGVGSEPAGGNGGAPP
jgi:hypothetical protein